MPPPLTLLSARFPPFGFEPPRVVPVEPLPAQHDTVGRVLRAVRTGSLAVEAPHPLARWPFHSLTPLPGDPRDELLSQWLREHTTASLACSYDASLAQRAHVLDDGTVCADYLFDAHYVLVHPEWRDPDHVALWHGTVAAKLFDDGVLLHTPAQLSAVVHWVSIRRKSTALGRRGDRVRTKQPR